MHFSMPRRLIDDRYWVRDLSGSNRVSFQGRAASSHVALGADIGILVEIVRAVPAILSNTLIVGSGAGPGRDALMVMLGV